MRKIVHVSKLFFLCSKMTSPCYETTQFSGSMCYILSSIGGLGMIGKVISVQGWQSITAVSFSCMVIFPFHTFINGSVTECILYALCFAQRSVVEVEWTAIHKKNIYRRGHGGKVSTASIVAGLYLCAHIHCYIQVDLKCTVSGSSCGGYYYPDHLLVLGQF